MGLLPDPTLGTYLLLFSLENFEQTKSRENRKMRPHVAIIRFKNYQYMVNLVLAAYLLISPCPLLDYFMQQIIHSEKFWYVSLRDTCAS